MPDTGTPSAVTPKRPDDGRISGSVTPSTPNIERSSSSHARVPMSHSNVRDAFDTSVAYSPVSFHSSQVSMVPTITFVVSTRSSSHFNFVALKYGSSTSPVLARTVG